VHRDPFAPPPPPPSPPKTPVKADRLPAPTYDELSAFYWKNVIIDHTAGHILYLEDTADFGVAEHIRFLGHFRPGGKLRPREGASDYNDKYERWIRTLVPDWFIEFATVTLLRFKYWITDPPTSRTDEKEMSFWSENHIVLFTSGEFILGQWWPQDTFTFTN